MTWKHFKALADVLAATRPTIDTSRVQQWRADVISIGNVCARFNSAFDRERFYRACGLEASK